MFSFVYGNISKNDETSNVVLVPIYREKKGSTWVILQLYFYNYIEKSKKVIKG